VEQVSADPTSLLSLSQAEGLKRESHNPSNGKNFWFMPIPFPNSGIRGQAFYFLSAGASYLLLTLATAPNVRSLVIC
jgi:hypothetical protein